MNHVSMKTSQLPPLYQNLVKLNFFGHEGIFFLFI